MKFVKLAVGLLLVVAGAPTAQSQPDTAKAARAPVTCADVLTELSKEVAQKNDEVVKAGAADIQDVKRRASQDVSSRILGSAEVLATCVSDNLYQARLQQVINLNRRDVQVGSGPGTSASTTAVSSPSAPALLGLAFESGATSNSLSSNTTTYRTTPAKLVAALSKAYGNTPPISDSTYNEFLRNISFGVSFNTSGSNTKTSNSGTSLQVFFNQVSQLSVRYDIINRRDVFGFYAYKKYQEIERSPLSSAYLISAHSLFEAIYRATTDTAPGSDPNYGMYHREKDALAVSLVDGTPKSEKDINDKLTKYFANLTKTLRDDARFKAALADFVDRWVEEAQNEKGIYDKIAKSAVLTAEYTLDRPPSIVAQSSTNTTSTQPVAPPDVSNARLIFTAPFVGKSEYTLNASAGFFDHTTSDMKGPWRDVQVGAKIQIPLPELPQLGKGTLTFSGLYLHLHQRPLGVDLNVNDVTINQPGNIGLFQAKCSFPIGDSGVSIPLSLTVSNRTDLIKESKVNGNFGITFDLDKLFAKYK